MDFTLNSSCVMGLGIEMTPQGVVLGADGAFMVNDTVDLGIVEAALQWLVNTISKSRFYFTTSGAQGHSTVL